MVGGRRTNRSVRNVKNTDGETALTMQLLSVVLLTSYVAENVAGILAGLRGREKRKLSSMLSSLLENTFGEDNLHT